MKQKICMVLYGLLEETLACCIIYSFMYHLSYTTSSYFMLCWIKHLVKITWLLQLCSNKIPFELLGDQAQNPL